MNSILCLLVFIMLKMVLTLADGAQLVGALSSRSKGHGFDSKSGHMPMLQVQYWIGARRRRQPIDV